MRDRAASLGVVDADRVDAVWVAAADLGPEHRSLLDLHLRHGLGPSELAQDLEMDRGDVEDHLSGLIARLEDLVIAALGAQPEPIGTVALFAASAVKPAPVQAKADVAAALARQGVPIQGSAALRETGFADTEGVSAVLRDRRHDGQDG